MNKCRGCKAEIGPTEARECPTHRRKEGSHLTHADMAVVVLELADGPLHLYDVHRGILREFGWAPRRVSLNTTVALDRRCCWAGRGLYGLWRHGLIPGPRRLVDVARIVLHAHQTPLNQDELTFTLRHLGVRFQPVTLTRVLTQSPTIKHTGWLQHQVDRSPAGTARLRGDIGLDLPAFAAVTQRVARQTKAALRERRRRLAVDRGLSSDDPVYDEGELGPAALYQ
jgi:hypothetical protein